LKFVQVRTVSEQLRKASASAALIRAALAMQWRAAPRATIALLPLTVVAGVAPAAVALLTRLLLNDVSMHRSSGGAVALLAVALSVSSVVVLLGSYASHYITTVIDYRLTIEAESRLFERVSAFVGLQRLEDTRFHDSLSLAINAAKSAPQNIGQLVQTSLRSTLSLATYIGALFVVWPPAVSLVLAAALPSVVVQLRSARSQSSAAEDGASRFRRQMFFRALLTDLRAGKEIRLFGLGSLFHHRLVDALREGTTLVFLAQKRATVAQALLALLGACLGGIGVVVIAVGAERGRFSVGDVTLFLASVAGVQSTILGVTLQLGQAHWALRLFRHYTAVMTTADDLESGGREIAPLSKAIEFRDVWFRYSPDSDWALRGLDLTIPAGCAVGLVGPNGAGKSTIVKLLCRLYDPERGQILWDGIDLRDLRVDALRERIAATFQDFMTYDLTASENIGLGKLSRLEDRARIRAAAANAGIDSILAQLPEGYGTMLSRTFAGDDESGRPGATLSGGEWQRVALARTLMRSDSDVLILDEPSSNLDAFAEHELHETVRRLGAGRTRLLISHRLNAIRDADRIVVLRGGEVVEYGSHDELMTRGGDYSRLFSLQAGRYQDPRVQVESVA
jgi:ATP-binding cassette subfamily B protein